jgi:subtilisin family serine protease
MALEGGGLARSPIIGDLHLPPAASTGTSEPDGEPADEPVPILVELNVLYPGGLEAVTRQFFQLWTQASAQWAGPPAPAGEPAADPVHPAVPAGLQRVTARLYQCMLTRRQLLGLIRLDRESAESQHAPPAIFKAWPDYELYPQIDRSAPTVKADAGWRSYNARGRGIVWAVIDSGIDGSHPHFSDLELAAEAAVGPGPAAPAAATGPSPAQARTAGLHHDFTGLVRLPGDPPPDPPAPLTDDDGHGTHVAGIIAGQTPPGRTPHVATSDEPPSGGGFVPRARVGMLSGMAPACELVSLKVLRRTAQGVWITSSAAVIAALEYLRTEVNVDTSLLRVHGVNISLGCPWDPTHYAAGQSPLSQAVNQLVNSGVVVVVSAGNGGGGQSQDPGGAMAMLGTITEPAHAEGCIAVGSTHRDAPHAFGVSWTSGKGPTLDGRMKPDVVAPGEWITSAAAGTIRARAGLDTLPPDDPDRALTYAEQSGTSMAAPHVCGVIAAFLSARPEYIGRPLEVKGLLTQSATDLGRERYAQGAGVVDLMRMLANA